MSTDLIGFLIETKAWLAFLWQLESTWLKEKVIFVIVKSYEKAKTKCVNSISQYFMISLSCLWLSAPRTFISTEDINV